MKRIYLIIGMVACFLGCADFDHYKPLGGNYYFASFGSKNALLYDFRHVGDGGGVVIISGLYLQFDYDDRYIVIMDSLETTNQKLYWIIDKAKSVSEASYDRALEGEKDDLFTSNVIGPLDSVAYNTQLKKKAIGIGGGL